MPIIHFINNKTQTAGGMKNVLNYGSKLKELDEYKHKLRLKAAKWIVISQSVLIALSAALQLWLR